MINIQALTIIRHCGLAACAAEISRSRNFLMISMFVVVWHEGGRVVNEPPAAIAIGTSN
jgi:hypothetical protein